MRGRGEKKQQRHAPDADGPDRSNEREITMHMLIERKLKANDDTNEAVQWSDRVSLPRWCAYIYQEWIEPVKIEVDARNDEERKKKKKTKKQKEKGTSTHTSG